MRGTRLPAKARTELNGKRNERDCGGEGVSLMVHSRNEDDGADGEGDHDSDERSLQV